MANEIESLVDDVVAAAWSPDTTLGDWWGALAHHRLTYPHWPEPWGRGWGPAEVATWRARLEHHGVLGPPTGVGPLMGAPILIDHGTDEQRTRMLPGLADGTSCWCQLFSEPGAGSDLAGLTTTAERDGDEWVVNGQKVWTSGGHVADLGMLIARTNWDVPKHGGLSYFILPMDQPGVEVRPLKQMNGAVHFSEVFLTDARVSQTDLIGTIGGGWQIARATLAYERRGLGSSGGGPRTIAGRRGGQLDRTVGDILEEHRDRDSAGADADASLGTSARLPELAGSDGLRPSDRDRVAALAIQERLHLGVAVRQPLAAKLAWTERMRAASATLSSVVGADAMLTEGGVGSAANFIVSQPAVSIAGGTDEIQRNILAERVLGLPREPGDDRDVPFREVPRNG